MSALPVVSVLLSNLYEIVHHHLDRSSCENFSDLIFLGFSIKIL